MSTYLNLETAQVIDGFLINLSDTPITLSQLDTLSSLLHPLEKKIRDLAFHLIKHLKTTLLSTETAHHYPWNHRKTAWIRTYFYDPTLPDSRVILSTEETLFSELFIETQSLMIKKYLNRHASFLEASSTFLEICEHPHIIKAFPDPMEKRLITEKLESVLDGSDQLSYPELKKMGHQILSALDFLHTHEIVHGDIQEASIGLSQSNWKLLNFQSATRTGQITKPFHTEYASPEKLKNRLSLTNPSDDIWSLGIVLTKLFLNEPVTLSSTPKFLGRSFHQIARHYYIPPRLADLLSLCLEESPEKRISAQTALEHPFFHDSFPITPLSLTIEHFVKEIETFTRSGMPIHASLLSKNSFHSILHFYLSGQLKCSFFMSDEPDYPDLIRLESDPTEKKFFLAPKYIKNRVQVTVRSCLGFSDGHIEEHRLILREHLPDSFWNVSEDSLWMLKHKNFYRNKIYPMVMAHLDTIPTLSKTQILEICAGDGELAELILEQNKETIEGYTLIDLNTPSLEKAKLRLDKNPKARFIQGDITQKTPYTVLSSDSTFSAPSLVLGIGALTQEVLPSLSSAKNSLTFCFEILRPGGHLLLTGLSASWITKSDLEMIGFQVIETMSCLITCYIAQKPELEPEISN